MWPWDSLLCVYVSLNVMWNVIFSFGWAVSGSHIQTRICLVITYHLLSVRLNLIYELSWFDSTASDTRKPKVQICSIVSVLKVFIILDIVVCCNTVTAGFKYSRVSNFMLTSYWIGLAIVRCEPAWALWVILTSGTRRLGLYKLLLSLLQIPVIRRNCGRVWLVWVAKSSIVFEVISFFIVEFDHLLAWRNLSLKLLHLGICRCTSYSLWRI